MLMFSDYCDGIVPHLTLLATTRGLPIMFCFMSALADCVTRDSRLAPYCTREGTLLTLKSLCCAIDCASGVVVILATYGDCGRCVPDGDHHIFNFGPEAFHGENALLLRRDLLHRGQLQGS
jgi:hypothetical protein